MKASLQPSYFDTYSSKLKIFPPTKLTETIIYYLILFDRKKICLSNSIQEDEIFKFKTFQQANIDNLFSAKTNTVLLKRIFFHINFWTKTASFVFSFDIHSSKFNVVKQQAKPYSDRLFVCLF